MEHWVVTVTWGCGKIEHYSCGGHYDVAGLMTRLEHQPCPAHRDSIIKFDAYLERISA
jgi:hypothetical protein